MPNRNRKGRLLARMRRTDGGVRNMQEKDRLNSDHRHQQPGCVPCVGVMPNSAGSQAETARRKKLREKNEKSLRFSVRNVLYIEQMVTANQGKRLWKWTQRP